MREGTGEEMNTQRKTCNAKRGDEDGGLAFFTYPFCIARCTSAFVFCCYDATLTHSRSRSINWGAFTGLLKK